MILLLELSDTPDCGIVRLGFAFVIQLDWTSCVDTHKNQFSVRSKGLRRIWISDEKLSTRRIQWWYATIHIFFLGGLFLKNRQNMYALKMLHAQELLHFIIFLSLPPEHLSGDPLWPFAQTLKISTLMPFIDHGIKRGQKTNTWGNEWLKNKQFCSK